MAEYLQKLLYYAFSGAWAVANGVAFVVTILGGIVSYKYPHRESVVAKLMWTIPLSIFGMVLVISLAIVAPYKIYKDQKQEISGLKSELITQKQISTSGINTNPVTQQEIRTFLESLKPEILARVDEHIKEIGIWLGSENQVKLASLSARPEFDRFLSFEKTECVCLMTGKKERAPFIRPTGEVDTLIGYYFYPKDALIK